MPSYEMSIIAKALAKVIAYTPVTCKLLGII